MFSPATQMKAESSPNLPGPDASLHDLECTTRLSERPAVSMREVDYHRVKKREVSSVSHVLKRQHKLLMFYVREKLDPLLCFD